MLLGHLSDLASDPRQFIYNMVLLVFALLIGITVHEFSHAFVAYKRGDDTASQMGRITLNPLAHLDPLGTVLLFVAGFGWGKPVPIDIRRMKPPLRFSIAAVSLAGIIANLVLAAFVAAVYRLAGAYLASGLLTLLETVVLINVLLAVFNLIPIPPLDGYNFFTTLLPERMARAMAPVAHYGPFILFGLMVIDSVLPASVFAFIGWPIRGIASILLGWGA